MGTMGQESLHDFAKPICFISKYSSIFTGFFSMIFRETSCSFLFGNVLRAGPGPLRNFDVRYLICFRRGVHMFSALPAL